MCTCISVETGTWPIYVHSPTSLPQRARIYDFQSKGVPDISTFIFTTKSKKKSSGFQGVPCRRSGLDSNRRWRRQCWCQEMELPVGCEAALASSSKPHVRHCHHGRDPEEDGTANSAPGRKAQPCCTIPQPDSCLWDLFQ